MSENITVRVPTTASQVVSTLAPISCRAGHLSCEGLVVLLQLLEAIALVGLEVGTFQPLVPRIDQNRRAPRAPCRRRRFHLLLTLAPCSASATRQPATAQAMSHHRANVHHPSSEGSSPPPEYAFHFIYVFSVNFQKHATSTSYSDACF